MAKARPLPTLVQMESRLGFIVDSLTYPDEMSDRFYSDLRLVSKSTYDKTMEEFEEFERRRHSINQNSISEGIPSQMEISTVGRFNHLRVLLTHSLEIGGRRRRDNDPTPKLYCPVQCYCGCTLQLRTRTTTVVH